MSCRIVQDRAGDAVYGAVVEQVAALVGFSVVSSITPGPNNILLWASGASFGFRRTVPHVLGTALGIGAMALVAAVAAGAILAAVPQLATAMKVAGSIYLLWLATQIVRAGALERTDVARPFGLVSAAAFQLVNPKALDLRPGRGHDIPARRAAGSGRGRRRGADHDARDRAHGCGLGGCG